MQAEHRLDQRGQPRGRPGVPDVAGRRGQGTGSAPGQSTIPSARVEIADARGSTPASSRARRAEVGGPAPVATPTPLTTA